MLIIRLYNSKILLFLQYILTPQFQTFTNLPIGIFGFSNPTYFLKRFLRNYVSIIVNIISNNTVLQCYLLWIFVSIKRLLQLIVSIGISTPPHFKNMAPSFAKSPVKFETIQAPFLTPPLKKHFMHTPPPPKKNK